MACALALLVTILLPGSAVADGTVDPGKVESHLTLDADRSGHIDVSTETVLHVSDRRGPIQEFLDSPIEAEREQRGEAFLSSGLGLFPAGTAADSAVEVEHGELIASSSESGSGQPGKNEWVGPFWLEWGDGLRVRTREPSGSAKPAWDVIVDLDQTQIGGVSPPPTSIEKHGSRTVVEWRFPPGGAEAARIALKPPWAVRVISEVDTSHWSMLQGIAYLVMAMLFLPFFWLLWRRHGDLGSAWPDGPLLRHQLKWLLTAASLSVLTALFIVLNEHLVDLFSNYSDWSPLARLPSELFTVLPAVGCIAAIFAAGRKPGAWRALLPGWVFAGALFVMIALVNDSRLFAAPTNDLDLKSGALSVAALLLLGILVAGLVNGLLRVLLSWVDEERSEANLERRQRQAAVATAILVVALLCSSAGVYLGHTSELQDIADFHVPNTLINAVFIVAPLLPLVLLPGVIRLLASADAPRPFLVQQPGLLSLAFTLYLFFVVPGRGGLAGFATPIPLVLGGAVLAILAAARLVRLDRLEDEVVRENPELHPDSVDESLLTEHRRELLDRALLSERLQRLRTTEHQKQAKSEEGGRDFLEYRKRLDELDDAERYLQTGKAPAGTTPSAEDLSLVSLKMPDWPPVLFAALAAGPGRNWRENGRIALLYGATISVLPIAYFIYTFARHDFGSVFAPHYGLELLSAASLLAGEVALWLVAAYTFGCLFTWLPWGNGTLKGLLMSLPVIVVVGLSVLWPVYAEQSDWVFRAFELLFFLSLVGLLMDFRTVRDAGLRWRDLFELYQVRSMRFGIVNLVPLLVAAIGIYQELRSGNPQSALEHAASAGAHLPGGEGGMP